MLLFLLLFYYYYYPDVANCLVLYFLRARVPFSCTYYVIGLWTVDLARKWTRIEL
jgi:hypothetical protein